MWNCIRYLIEANIYCVHIIPSAMKSYLTEQVKDSSCFLLVHVDFTFHFVFCKFAPKKYFMHLIEAKLLFFLLSEPMSTRRVYSWSFSLRPFSLFQGTWQGLRTILIQVSLNPYIWPLQRSWLNLVFSVQSVYQDMLNLFTPISVPVSFCKEQDS